MDWVEPRTCIDENLTVDDNGHLKFQRWAVPRLVRDVIVRAPAATVPDFPQIILPGYLLMNQELGWVNDSPLDADVRLLVTRSWREWITSNPNVLQFRDRWTWAIDRTPDVPVTNDIVNGQVGSGIDLGTNTVAEPMPGKQWRWSPAVMSTEWVTLGPAQKLNVHYRAYVWSPPQWSDNANKNSPVHQAGAGFTRLQMIAYPTPGTVVTG